MATLPKVQSGDVLTTQKWNSIVDEVNNLSGSLTIQKGIVNIGSAPKTGGKLTIAHDSSGSSTHLELLESGSTDFARISFKNSASPTNAWHLAAHPGADNPRIGFWYRGGDNKSRNIIDLDGKIGGSLKIHESTSLSFGKGVRQMINLWGALYGIGVQHRTQYFRSHYNFAWYAAGEHHNDAFEPGEGGQKLMTLTNKGDLTVSGGLIIQEASSSISFGKNVRQMINLWGTQYGIGVQAHTQYFRSHYNFAWYAAGEHHKDKFAPGAGGRRLMTLDSNGNLTISGRLKQPSDINLKEDISYATNLLQKVIKINPVYFKYKSADLTSPKQLGVIAQEVKKIFPDLVSESGDKQKSLTVDYLGFIMLAIQSIKELKEEIDNLTKNNFK